MNFISIIFFSIIAVALVIYFIFYIRGRNKDVVRLLPENTEIKSIKYELDDWHIEIHKENGEWKIVSPEYWYVAPEKMRRLILKLVTLDIREYRPGANPAKAEYGIGTKGELTIDGSDRLSISIGALYPKDEELIYIRKTDERGLSLISSSILEVLPKSIAEYRNMLLFDGFVSQVSSMEAGNCEGAFLLVRTEQAWIMSGRNVFDEKVKPFLEEVLELEAEAFGDDDFKLPPKPEVYIVIKINRKTVTRNFFSFDDSYYVTPVEAKLLKIKKSVLQFIFDFK